MNDSDVYAQRLLVSNALLEPAMRSAIQALALPPGSRGLDAGCGMGLQSLLLAQAVGPDGHVTGLDLSPGLLRCAERTVRAAGRAAQISFRQGDVSELPFEDDTFDWAWSAHCVGYAASIPPLPTLRELARVVKPGGTVALLAWSSEKLLPGYPRLEALLGATAAGIAPFVRGMDPALHFMRALGWFRAAGLVEVTARTLVSDVHAPLSDPMRRAMIDLLEMRWPSAESALSEEDRATYRSLCLPDSPEFILDHPDYYAFFTFSMFHGRVAG